MPLWPRMNLPRQRRRRQCWKRYGRRTTVHRFYGKPRKRRWHRKNLGRNPSKRQNHNPLRHKGRLECGMNPNPSAPLQPQRQGTWTPAPEKQVKRSTMRADPPPSTSLFILQSPFWLDSDGFFAFCGANRPKIGKMGRNWAGQGKLWVQKNFLTRTGGDVSKPTNPPTPWRATWGARGTHGQLWGLKRSFGASRRKIEKDRFWQDIHSA